MALVAQTVAQKRGEALSAEGREFLQNILRAHEDLVSMSVYLPDAALGFSGTLFHG